jgi:predicted HicB family RNase H-like nuclease
VSTHKNERRGSPPFQFRLNPELRDLMEEAQRQDGDESLAAWIKRIIRKELQQRGIEPKG